MREIIFTFPGLGYKNINQAEIFIYSNNILILKEKTYNGRIITCLNSDIYQITVKSKYETKRFTFFLSNHNSIYSFPLNSSYACNNGKTITFLLTDFNYINLPIEKGLINVWQKQ